MRHRRMRLMLGCNETTNETTEVWDCWKAAMKQEKYETAETLQWNNKWNKRSMRMMLGCNEITNETTEVWDYC